MKKIHFLFIVFIAGISLPILAQKQGPALMDSLRTELVKAKEDSNKVNVLNKLSYELCGMGISEDDTSKKYAEDALAVSRKINFKKGIGTSLTNIGKFYESKDNYTEALKNHLAALKIFEEAGDKKGIARSAFNIGMIYFRQGSYPDALKNYFFALKIREELGDKKGSADIYYCIGIIYDKQHNYADALKNFSSTLKVYEELGDKMGIAGAYLCIGGIYERQGQYAEGLKNFLDALKIYEETGNKRAMNIPYTSIGSIYQRQKNYPDALKNYLAALKICEEVGNRSGMTVAQLNIGYTKLDQRNFKEGKEWIMKALETAKQMGNVDLLKKIYEELAAADNGLGNYKGAYENYQLFILYRDSVYNEENTKKTVQTSMQYEFDKKEAFSKAEQEKKDALTKAEMRKQKIIRNSIGLGLAIVALFSIVVYRQRNKISKEKKRSDELLLNILPAETAEELKNTGTTKAKDFNEVTVMFTDFKNFTSMSETLTAQELVNEINYCYSAFDHIITKHGLEKIKTIGDSYMCAGGLPKESKTNAEDTVRAALDIRDFIEEEKQKRISAGLPYFDIRIGCNTGSVVAGIVGIKKFAYDIWGDTVNIASRMESSGEPGKVNVSGSTYELVKDHFNCEHRGKIQAKNKGEIDMYFVTPKI